MGFGAELQGRQSHEALIKVQDAEIKLLEILKRFVSARAEADKQYASSLSRMMAQATKGDTYDIMEFQDCCAVFRAWDTQLQETEKFIQLIRTNSETLATRTVDSLTFLIAEKKNARRIYFEQRNSLDSQMSKHQQEVQKNHKEYSILMDRLKLDRAKYQDVQSKGKGGGKVDDCKSKYVRTMNRLHQQHNDYILALTQANQFQNNNLQHFLPATLNCHQAVQELYVTHLKFILKDLAALTDMTTQPFQEISQNISKALASISPESEYGSAFISKYKSDALEPIQFEFDNNLIVDYNGSLRPGQLELDDLTFETLTHRRTRLDEELKTERQWVETHQKQIEALTSSTAQLEERFNAAPSADLVKELVEKRKQLEVERKEVEEKQANMQSLEELINLLATPLKALGDSAPPSAFEAMENGDVTGDSRSVLSASSKDSEGGKRKMKLPTVHLNIFRKGVDKSNGKVRSSQEDVHAEGADESVSDLRKGSSGSTNRMGGYEQTEPGSFSPTPNGPSRSSMAAMREGGTILTDTIPATGVCRIDDEEWFHGVLPREEVQRLLTQDGDYLVRESKNRKTNETHYVLSVYWGGHKHFIIQGAEEVGWRFEGASYPTVRQLIMEQQNSGQPVTSKSQAILRKAVSREDWELLNDHIHLEMKIGNGNFGEVYKGVYVPRNMVVAVKTCRDTLSEDMRKKFLLEGRILKQYNHPNIVSFIGIAAQRQPVMIVMEYVPGGALLLFLRKQGKQQTQRQLTQMCVDAGNGMAYLEERGCIHRDLAARNCLVGDNNVIKISDFGMSREEEEYIVSEGMKQIPIKWTAPEALNYGKYTSLCDVWSFGVLMWEIFSAGQQPYPGMTNAEAKRRVEEGYRMPQNSQMPDTVYQLMLRCWEYIPEKRPHFREIHETLKDIVRRL